MSTRTRRPVISIEFVRESAYFHGVLQRDLMPAVRAVGAPYQWSHARRALGVPATHAAEVEARLVAAGFTVEARLPAVGS